MTASKASPVISAAVDRILWPDGFMFLKGVARTFGGSVGFADLSQTYASSVGPVDPRRVRFTGLSDGRRITLHRPDRGPAAEPVHWAWDTLHLLGHMFQWSIPAHAARASRLRHFGPAAAAMAVQDFVGAPEPILRRMQAYELEANGLALAVFKDLVSGSAAVTPGAARLMLADMRRFMAADLAFLSVYYGADPVARWASPAALLKRLRPIPPPPPRDLRFVVQSAACIPVVHPNS